ncbi:MAG: helix-turn-helix domain-containing protein [Pleurocapsa sp. MO_226.B13]|nr:helix-turn-helix domain-containing protein [Pleurocapsa sp. MO_226.B13]
MVSSNEQEPLLNKGCPLRQVINIIGDKWTLPVLYVLTQGTKRYSELQHEIPGISKKMLTQTLRRLESDKIVKRKVYPVVPPKTEYNLTVFGKKLIEPLEVLANWAEVHQVELQSICDRRNQNSSKQKGKSNQQQAK